jgi:hypothetical protein
MGCNCKKINKSSEIPIAVSQGYIQLNVDKKTRVGLIIAFILLSPFILISSAIRKWKKVIGLKRM